MKLLKGIFHLLINFFTVKKLLWCVLGLLLLILLTIPLLNYFDALLVVPVYSKVGQQPLWLRNTLFGLVGLCAGLIFYQLYRNKKYKPSKALIYFLVLCVIFYCMILFSRRYIFYGFTASNTPWLAYTNIFLLADLALIIYYFKVPYNQTPESKIVQPSPIANSYAFPFEKDEPVTDTGPDLFGRLKFAERVASKIKNTAGSKEAISIGITGSWGSGKTSFLNMVKSFLVQSCTVIPYNPWKNDNTESMIKSFFQELSAAIEIPGNRYIRKKIMEYASIIADLEPNLYTQTLKTFTELQHKKQDEYQELYDSINDYITALDKKLVIFIDDIDRLDKKEIIQVLKIMRKTASFANITYVAAYDKNYVLEAVKELNPYNYTTYLEKIFLFEFQLPIFESAIIRRQIKDRLVKVLSNNEQKEANGLYFPKEEIHTAIDLKSITGINFTDELVQTERQAIRLVNSFLFEIENVKDEVNFLDFYLLQLIKSKYPGVYIALQKKDRFFTEMQRDSMRLTLKNQVGEPLSGKPGDDVAYLQHYLSDRSAALAVTEEDQQNIMLLINELLYRDQNTVQSGLPYRVTDESFRYEINFQRYFALRLLTTDLSEAEFNKCCNKDYSHFHSDLDAWLKQGKAKSVLYHLGNFVKATNQNEFENRIKALLFYVSIGLYQIYHYQSEWTKEKLLSFMSWPVYKKGKEINFYKSVSDYRKFINEVVFNKYGYVKFVERSNLFFRWAIEYPDGNAAYTRDEMLATCQRVLDDYCTENSNSTSISEEFFTLLKNCKTNRPDGTLTLGTPIRQRLKQYILHFSPEAYTGIFISQADNGNIKIRKRLLQQVFSHTELQSFTIGPSTLPGVPLSLNELNLVVNRFTKLALLEIGGTYTLHYIKPINWPVLDDIEGELT